MHKTQHSRVSETLPWNYHVVPGIISDVFDSQHYRNLMETTVTVDGKKLAHKYFSGQNDIAFSVCLGGYLLYKWRCGGPSTTPICYEWLTPHPFALHSLLSILYLLLFTLPKPLSDFHQFVSFFTLDLLNDSFYESFLYLAYDSFGLIAWVTSIFSTWLLWTMTHSSYY